MTIVAIIPARGGSKRIPRKNIRTFAGKPIMAYAIEAALNSRLFQRILVSTDDLEIASIARNHGAEVPELRPQVLADDFVGTDDVMAYELARLAESTPLTWACCLYATAPFLTPEDLIKGHAALVNSGKAYAFSATTFPFPIQRAIRINGQGGVAPMFPAYIESRSQDLEEAYHDAGQFYWGTAQAFIQRTPLFGPDATAVLLPRHRVQDIDTLEDWDRAEQMFLANVALKARTHESHFSR